MYVMLLCYVKLWRLGLHSEEGLQCSSSPLSRTELRPQCRVQEELPDFRAVNSYPKKKDAYFKPFYFVHEIPCIHMGSTVQTLIATVYYFQQCVSPCINLSDGAFEM